jgi:transposase
MRKDYPSDITKEQFETIRADLSGAKKSTKPRKVDLYEVFCALLYLLKSGCQWRMLPSEFPKWELVYYYFTVWSKRIDNNDSLLEKVLKKLVGLIRTNDGRAETTSFCIVDAQSIQNADTAENKGYDAGKKVSGIKRHIAVDTNGLPHALYVTTANVTDRAGAILMFESAKDNLALVQNVLVDGGYTGETFANKVNEILGARVEVVKRNELHEFVVLPKRWVGYYPPPNGDFLKSMTSNH